MSWNVVPWVWICGVREASVLGLDEVRVMEDAEEEEVEEEEEEEEEEEDC